MQLKGMSGAIWEPAYAQIDLKHAIITLKDGGAGSAQNTLVVTVGEGNLTYTERRNIEYILNRGNLNDVREGDQVPVEVSLDFVWEYITGGPASGELPTVEDVLKHTGLATGWVSTDDDGCRPFAIDIEIEYLPVPSTCGDKEVITLADYRYEELPHDLRAGTIVTSGKCNITEATAVRSVQP